METSFVSSIHGEKWCIIIAWKQRVHPHFPLKLLWAGFLINNFTGAFSTEVYYAKFDYRVQYLYLFKELPFPYIIYYEQNYFQDMSTFKIGDSKFVSMS